MTHQVRISIALCGSIKIKLAQDSFYSVHESMIVKSGHFLKCGYLENCRYFVNCGHFMKCGHFVKCVFFLGKSGYFEKKWYLSW